jgi:hypothetical protein
MLLINIPNEIMLEIATSCPFIFFNLMKTSKYFYNLLKSQYAINLLYKKHKYFLTHKDEYYSWNCTYLDKILHSFDNKPSIVIQEDNFKVCEIYYNYGVLHNDNGPAIKVFLIPSNTVIFFEYWYMGKLHRLNEPARFELYKGIEYWFMGKLHNDTGPAIHKSIDKIIGYIQEPDILDILNIKTIVVNVKEYWKNGLLHNENGPAIINEDANIEEYWINGVKTNWTIIDYDQSFNPNFTRGSLNNSQLKSIFSLPYIFL